MKTRKLMALMTCALMASTSACTAEPKDVPVEETTESTQQSIVTSAGSIMMWPAGPLVWDGLVGTWPISVWSPATIGAVAFDMVGVTNIGVSLVGFSNIAPMTITTPFLNAFMPTAVAPVGALGVADPLLGTAGFFAPAFGFQGAFTPFLADGLGWGAGAFAPGLGAVEASLVGGAFAPGFASWMTPALTSSAFMFTNLVALDAFTPYTFNVTFTAASAAQAASIATSAAVASSAAAMSSLSIFATPILPSAIAATIPFTSIVYPFLPPLVPAVGPPLVGAPVVGVVPPVL